MVQGTRHIPSKGLQNLVSFSVKINGEPLSRSLAILGLVVDKSVNRIASAMLQIKDGAVANQDFKVSSSDVFIPGNEIEIWAGYNIQEELIFKGIIVKHAIRLWKSGQTVLDIQAKDKAVHLIMSRKNALFENKRDSEAFVEIADNYGLSLESDSTSTVHEQLVQYNAMDWDFLVSRAEANGMVVLTTDNQIFVKRPQVANTAKLSLTYGATLFEFEEEIDIRNQVENIKASAWDPANQEKLSIEAEPASMPEAGNLSSASLSGIIGPDSWQVFHGADLEEPELQAWANGVRHRSKLAKIRGRVCCQGIATVLPGDTVELRGLGARFNGLAYVSSVQHKLGDGNWLTYLGLGLSPETYQANKTHISAPSAAGLLPAISGMHTGIITQLAGDPAGEDRIRVRVPLISDSGDGLWARLTTLDAGQERGAVFRPEIGDEVLVSFIHDDPRKPVILGMLHSSAKPSPITASDDNHLKGVVSRSGIRFIFDDENTVVKLETPNGKKIELDESKGTILLEDENGNRIELSNSGISIESSKDILFKATGDVKIQGLNIEAIASATFKATGSASAELSASGNTVVKGSLVQIN